MTDISSSTSTSSPLPIGPYSQVVPAGGFFFCSGQIGIGEDGTLIPGGVIAETVQALENIRIVLTSVKRTFADVVRVEVYLTDMKYFPLMNEQYAKAFKGVPRYPARITVGVSELPKNASVEIACIAVR